PLLVVDDDRGSREVLREILEWDGYEVATARDGLEAIAKLAGPAPALVLLDTRLPRLDGLGLLEALLGRHGAVAASVVRMLTDEQLGRTGADPFRDRAPISSPRRSSRPGFGICPAPATSSGSGATPIWPP